jgi:hypothetical protein
MVPDHRLDNELSKVNSDKVKGGYLYRSSFFGLGNESFLGLLSFTEPLLTKHSKIIIQFSVLRSESRIKNLFLLKLNVCTDMTIAR